MSSEISEIEKCKDEIYQLSFLSLRFTQALHRTVLTEMERQNTEMMNLISNYETRVTTIDKWNEVSQICKKADMFAGALKNLTSCMKTTQEIFSKEMKAKEIPSIKITKQDPK
eukprot:2804_1